MIKTKQTKPIDELVKNISEGLDLVPAIKVIVKCNSILALETLRKVLNNRLKELRKIDKEKEKKNYIDVGRGFDAEHKHRMNMENRKAIARINADVDNQK